MATQRHLNPSPSSTLQRPRREHSQSNPAQKFQNEVQICSLIMLHQWLQTLFLLRFRWFSINGNFSDFRAMQPTMLDHTEPISAMKPNPFPKFHTTVTKCHKYWALQMFPCLGHPCRPLASLMVKSHQVQVGQNHRFASATTPRVEESSFNIVKIGTGITVTSALSTGFFCKCCTWTCPENPRPVNPCNSQNSYAHPVQIIFHDNIYIIIYIY